MPSTIDRISADAVANATGRDWDAWLAALDDRGAADRDHRDIVALVADAGVENGWWQQTIATGYEQARGLRAVGETADAGFQVGVQRTLPVGQDRLWELLIDPAGREAWLGAVDAFDPAPGHAYETADGTTGEVRTVTPGERLRLTWRPPDRDGATTLQLTLTCPRNDASKTTLRFHHERLADADERAAMRERWQAAADRLEALTEPSHP